MKRVLLTVSQKLLSLKEKWDEAERIVKNLNLPHIPSDMNAKMIVSERRLAGLGDNFYYNNGSESINSSLKKEIYKQKQHSSSGKPSYVEFIDIEENFAGKYRRNFHQAVKGDGPYQFVPEFSELEVTEEIWRGLSPRERAAKIYAIDQVGANSYKSCDIQAGASVQLQARVVSTAKGISSSLPVDFYLPQTFEATWNNTVDFCCYFSHKSIVTSHM